MKTLIKPILLVLALASVNLWAKEPSPVEVKIDSLNHLQELRTQNVKHLEALDQAISKKLDNAQLTDLSNDIDNLQAEKREHLLRQKLIDRLIFQIDTKFSSGDLRAFLEHALLDMAKVDAISDAAVNGEEGLWKFLKYSADAIHRLPEQRENILGFLEGYMNRSVSNPILPQDYLASRNYTNAAASEQGHPMNREDVGAIADQRLHQQAIQPAKPQATSTLRADPTAPVTQQIR